MNAPVTLLSWFHAADAAAASVLATGLLELARTVPSEPGNLAYTVYRAEEDNTLFYVHEQWSTPGDAARHVDRIAADPTAQQSSALLASPIQTATLRSISTNICTVAGGNESREPRGTRCSSPAPAQASA